MNSQDIYHYKQDVLSPGKTVMTLEEFLESDLEGYEYVNGELVYMQPKTLELGGACTNTAFFLGEYVRDNSIGRIYFPYTAYKIGEYGLIPDLSYISTERLPDYNYKSFYVAPNIAVEVVFSTDTIHQIQERCLHILKQAHSWYGYLNLD